MTSIQTVHSSFFQVPHPMVSPLPEICLQTPSDCHALSPHKASTGTVKGQSHPPFFVPDLHSEIWIKKLSGGEAWKGNVTKGSMWKGQAPSAKWSCCPIKHPPSGILPISHHSFLTPFPGRFLEKSIPFLPTVVIDLSFPRVSSALELLWLGPLLPRTLQLVTQTPALR